MPLPIEDYAIIGDCETAALVGKDGSIDWLCWPRFDSGACFAALLGTPEHGRWKIAPENVKKVSRRYRPGTLILETEFQTETGTAKLTDFMPIRDRHSDIIRIVQAISGEVELNMELVIRFDYGRSIPWVTHQKDRPLTAVTGPDMIVLRTAVETEGKNLKTVSKFTLKQGESAEFTLTYAHSNGSIPRATDVTEALRRTEQWWMQWIDRCTYDGPWAEELRRSLITLKALTYGPSGGVLAAATTSLPEARGGPRNWDYRFCWLRDATFTLLALLNAGYHAESRDWQNWLLRAAAGNPAQTQVLYGIEGERPMIEWEVPWLPGYQGAAPVRVGNAAANQLQLDIFGEIVDVIYQSSKGNEGSEAAIDLQTALLDYLEKIWHEPDSGMWEFRGPTRHFTHSKVMAWVAFDRVIKTAEKLDLNGPLDHWRAVREEIFQDVCRNGFDQEMGSFVQSYGSKLLDANLLLIPLVGFLPHTDPRIKGTVAAIEKHLKRGDFVLRYQTEAADDGLPPGEGAFFACSFWLADNYILLGRHQDARELLSNLLKLRNDVGLFAEEYDLEHKSFLGNFPQAFSHVALANTIMNLGRVDSPAVQRSEAQKPEQADATTKGN
jgi:GH15 family glucan-1,4-alpha-glucosidase